ncbi:Bug family tripartite tricarboxylate transporter substrate binding protein [Enterovirga rhinocerotis]|uniref:Tripartite-type tricarboxylate transporter receptor subunit TctC n=1 Tax=Enterovirga rhinocerotis TaxID=1339210 RepID=A0A4R7CAH1_9HYPH|nr:tripartite tricarboxylate transporter substrate binding protein [Enterovirga rhinocerotis]TDR94006.1 tripartite-type tricarboxylate transporter receptor subunit TctC [Enterovirga rhinocerotis]
MPSTTTRRAALTGAAALITAPTILRAQSFPTRPITMIVPWTPGSSSDAALRVMAEAAARHLKGNIVIENKPGLAGVRGAIDLAGRTQPDGYTISQFPLTVYRYPFTSKVSFDPSKDFTYIIQLTGYTFGIVVQGKSPYKTFADLVAYAKANPGKVTYGSPGTHTSLHVGMIQLGEILGVEWTHVPYKGGAETTKALLAGDVTCVADASGWAPQVQNGDFRLLNTWGASRSKPYPDVPTLKELGYDLVSTSPYGLAGPKGMEPQVVAALHDAFKASLSDPAVLRVLGTLGQEVEYLNPQDYAASIPGIMTREKAIAEKLGLKPA